MPVLCDLEADDLREHIGSAHAIVFAAGAGPGSGPERKRTVDYGGAVKLIEAARELGVARYVMVSAMGTSDVEHAGEAMRPYLQAKKDADDALMASGLDWTVVRPGRLTDEPGTGTVDAARALGRRGEITRDDTALALLETLRPAVHDRRRLRRPRGPDAGRRGDQVAVANCGATARALPGIDPAHRRLGMHDPTPPRSPTMFPANAYVIRLAGDADEPDLDRLAALNGAPPLEHPIIVGEIKGVIAAALDMDANVVYSDPFVAVRTLPTHLRLRAMAIEAAAEEPDVAERIRRLMRGSVLVPA